MMSQASTDATACGLPHQRLDLEVFIRALLPYDVAVAALFRHVGPAPLHAAEAAAVAGAVESRRREFALGRECARRALAVIGYPDAVIPAEADRSPRWPDGAVGSISHTADYVAAIAAPRSRYLGLGIDLERIGRVAEDLWPHLFDATERQSLMREPPADRPRRATILFSAKESFYKAQYSWSRRWLDFRDVHVVVDDEHLRALDLTEPGSQPLVGRHASIDELVVTTFCSPAQA